MTIFTSEQSDAIQVNIYIHSLPAKTGEHEKSPHFRLDNYETERSIIFNQIKDLIESNIQSQLISDVEQDLRLN